MRVDHQIFVVLLLNELGRLKENLLNLVTKMSISNPKSIRAADIRNKLQSFFTILEKLEKGEEVPRKIVSVAKRDLKIFCKLIEGFE